MTIDKKTKKNTSLTVVSGQDLGFEFGDAAVSSVGFSTWVRSLSQNWRQGTVSCKGRSDVGRTNKKPWKQKGTGRARAGSARSPIWRGGGVTFGPQPRVKSLKTSKALRKKVLKDLLYSYISSEKVVSLDWSPSGDVPKTSAAFAALKNAQLLNEKIVLFVSTNDLLTRASYANISNVNILYFDQANAFDLANSSYWVYLNKDKESFKGMVNQWI